MTGMIYATLTRYDTALAYAGAAVDMAARLGSPWHVGSAEGLHGMVSFFRGETSRRSGTSKGHAKLCSRRATSSSSAARWPTSASA